MIEPTNELTRSLLHYFMRKTFLWVNSLHSYFDYSDGKGIYGNLKWDFSDTRSLVTVSGFCTCPILISWDKSLEQPIYIATQYPNFIDLTKNLDEFVNFEKYVFDILEEMSRIVNSSEETFADLEDDWEEDE